MPFSAESGISYSISAGFSTFIVSEKSFAVSSEFCTTTISG
jgi:hypothetical protein